MSKGVMLQHVVDITEAEATKIANEDISNRAQNFAKDLNMGVTVDERIADTRGDKPRTIPCITFSRKFNYSATAADVELLKNDIKKFFEWFKEQKFQKHEAVATEEVHNEEACTEELHNEQVCNDDIDNWYKSFLAYLEKYDWYKEQEEEDKKFREKMKSLLRGMIMSAIFNSEGMITKDETEFVKNLGENLLKTGEIPFIEATFIFKQREGIAIRCPGNWLIKAITAYLEKYGNTGRKSSKHQ